MDDNEEQAKSHAAKPGINHEAGPLSYAPCVIMGHKMLKSWYRNGLDPKYAREGSLISKTVAQAHLKLSLKD